MFHLTTDPWSGALYNIHFYTGWDTFYNFDKRQNTCDNKPNAPSTFWLLFFWHTFIFPLLIRRRRENPRFFQPLSMLFAIKLSPAIDAETFLLLNHPTTLLSARSFRTRCFYYPPTHVIELGAIFFFAKNGPPSVISIHTRTHATTKNIHQTHFYVTQTAHDMGLDRDKVEWSPHLLAQQHL